MLSMNDNYENAAPYAVGSQNSEADLCENLEFWMGRLPLRLQTLPLVQLAIPGSHNSMTYTVERSNGIGPDEPAAVRAMGRYFSLLAKPVIFNWSVNQEVDIKDQLNGGIRYLDLRVATKSNDGKIYFLHGLYGSEIGQPLQDVADWLSMHPNEVLVIDFQHFYNFNEAYHRGLIDQIRHYFRGKMCPVFAKLNHVTLQWMSMEKYRVIVVYRNIAAQNYNNLWPHGLWPTPWPNTVSATRLVNFLNESLRKRSPDSGFISQCLLTPDIPYVMKHLCGSLRKDLANKCRQATMSWVQENSPGRGGMNIVITDFVSDDNYSFTKAVIQRNAHLLNL